MNDTQRDNTRAMCVVLAESTRTLATDLHNMSDEIIEISWAQVQADFEALTRRMTQ